MFSMLRIPKLSEDFGGDDGIGDVADLGWTAVGLAGSRTAVGDSEDGL
jgi:hypothetical protein